MTKLKYNFDIPFTFAAATQNKFGKRIANLRLITLSGLTMGGRYTIKFTTSTDKNITEIDTEILKKLNQLENQMSIFIDQSDIMQFNRTKVGEWFSPAIEMYENLQIAEELMQFTKGALDITLGKTIEAWGFGKTKDIPSFDSIPFLSQTSPSDVMQIIELDDKTKRIKKNKDCHISLNAIAKGYAADHIAQYLRALKISNFLVEISGEIVASGQKPDSSNWQIAIEKPLVGVSETQQVLNLSNISLATSGDYRKCYEKSDTRYSHIINANTSQPIDNNLASVTVAHSSAAKADALATALLVMGETHGVDFATQNNISAYFIVKCKNCYTTYMTPPFAKLIPT